MGRQDAQYQKNARNLGANMAGHRIRRMFFALAAAGALAGCQEGLPLLKKAPGDRDEAGRQTATRIVERDVEAPEIFQVTEAGLWDGRPSLGGVWVAHPDVADPERVIIRNEANGKFVIGALFKRERDNPGPRLQVSSDAASALGVLAGQPTTLNVTALRRETVEETPAAPPIETVEAAPAEAIATEQLDDPIASAAAAIDAAEAGSGTASTAKPQVTPAPRPDRAAAAAPTQPEAQPAPLPASRLSKPFVQIGIFSVKANAEETSSKLRKSGILPTVLEQSSSGKTFWRVVVGPARNYTERAQLMKQIKSLGYSDAYFVTN